MQRGRHTQTRLMQYRERCDWIARRRINFIAEILCPEVPMPQHRVKRHVERKKRSLTARRLVKDSKGLHIDPNTRFVVGGPGRPALPPSLATPERRCLAETLRRRG